MLQVLSFQQDVLSTVLRYFEAVDMLKESLNVALNLDCRSMVHLKELNSAFDLPGVPMPKVLQENARKE